MFLPQEAARPHQETFREQQGLTSGHPWRQQGPVVLWGWGCVTQRDFSIPKPAEAPRIKACCKPLSSSSSQARPARTGRLRDPQDSPHKAGRDGRCGCRIGRGVPGPWGRHKPPSPSPAGIGAAGGGAGGVPGNQRGRLGSIVSLLRLQRTMGHCCLWGSHCLLSLQIPAAQWMEVSRGPGRLRVWDTK